MATHDKNKKVEKDKTKLKADLAENKEAKRQTILTNTSGLESNYQKGILGFQMIEADKISIHKEIINEDLDRNKVDTIEASLIDTFDPKLSVIYVTPVLRSGEKYVPNRETQYKALDGRHLLTAIKNIYHSGKTLKGLEPMKVMAVVVRNEGVIAANYANMRTRYLNEQHTSHVLIQDFLKLYRRIYETTHDREQSVEIVKNSMLLFNFLKDDVTALGKMSKWSDGALQVAIEMSDGSS